MKILVTGANGMLGTDLTAVLKETHEVIGADRSGDGLRIDITDESSVHAVLEETVPDVVVNTAAWTDVDGATRTPDAAFEVNAWGAWNVAAACEKRGIALCHLSTDFVFDGEKRKPYTEFDATNPINAYGAGKLAGETAIRWVTKRAWIVRTQWLYGVHGANFPYTILRLARERDRVNVVDDQVGAPTWTGDLARLIATIIDRCPFGTYHANNAGETSWHGFASAVLEEAGMDPGILCPIPASEYPSPTRRPAYSTLRRLSLEMQGKDTSRPWREPLQDFMAAARREGRLDG